MISCQGEDRVRSRTGPSRRRRSLLVEPLEGRRLLAVSKITLTDFANPEVLDFESVEVGSISGTDARFTDFGISAISATGFNSTDDFELRPNSSRALWADDDGLRVVDPGTINLRNDALTYTIELVTEQNRFGIGVHEQGGVYVLQLFSGPTDVGIFAYSSGHDLTQRYIESSTTFDKIIVHYTSRDNNQGFAIDNITLEGAGNHSPNAVDDSFVIDEDAGPVPLDVAANDHDPDGDLLSPSLKAGPINGVLEDNGDGTFTYTPAANFHGIDSFTYQTCDSNGLCDQATVTITVNSVIDATVDVASKRINLKSRGAFRITLLSTQISAGEIEDFDATSADTSTIQLNGTAVDPVRTAVRDVDDDGDLDLVLHYSMRDIVERGVLDSESVDLVFAAEFSGGTALGPDVLGIDAVRLTPSMKRSGEHSCRESTRLAKVDDNPVRKRNERLQPAIDSKHGSTPVARLAMNRLQPLPAQFLRGKVESVHDLLQDANPALAWVHSWWPDHNVKFLN